MNQNTAVVVIGGGYAGVTAADRLTRRDDVTVTLINPRPAFVERIRLHQLVGGSHDATVDYAQVLAERVRLVVDTVTGIDAAARTVALGAGGTLRYDYLVHAVGSHSADPGVPGAREHAFPLAGLEEARRLREALTPLPPGAAVTVVGAGATGIETAAELAEQGGTVTLVCGGPLGPSLHRRGRRAVARHLAALGVTVLDGAGTRVTAVTRDGVDLADGRHLAGAVTVWTTGFAVPDLAARSGLSTDAVGRLLTDETLTSVDDVRVVAAGDAAAPSGLPFRMSCQAAGPLGARAADTVLSRIAGEEPAPLALLFVGQCLSLGRRAGVVQFARRDDTPVGLHLAGRAGARVKEVVCRGTVRQLALEARRPGRTSPPRWAGDPRRRMLLASGRGDARRTPATQEGVR